MSRTHVHDSIYVYDLEERVRSVLLNIDVAIAHLKSIAFANNDPSIASAIAWLNDAKSELQTLLDYAIKNTVVFIDSATVSEITKKTRVRAKDAVEVLIRKCIDEHVSEHK
jgi:hypothetical protein